MIFRGHRMNSQNKQSANYRKRQELLKPLLRKMDSVLTKWIEVKASEREDLKALDVGTGFGDMLQLLISIEGIEEITTIDPSSEVIDEIRSIQQERYPNSKVLYQEAYAEDIPLPDENFDLVVSRISLHHFQDSKAALSEMLRVLKPNGWLILTDWTKLAPAFSEDHKAAFLSVSDAKTLIGQVPIPHVITAIAKIPEWYAFLIEKN